MFHVNFSNFEEVENSAKSKFKLFMFEGSVFDMFIQCTHQCCPCLPFDYVFDVALEFVLGFYFMLGTGESLSLSLLCLVCSLSSSLFVLCHFRFSKSLEMQQHIS